MKSKIYNDYERQQIAEKEYDIYGIGNTIKINTDTEIIGYVSEIKSKLSGENTYIVTDVPLPVNPTEEDLAKVGHITVLYQGSTANLVEQPAETLVDWGINDAFMAARILVPDVIPTRPTIQLRDASHTLQETLEKYPNATFSIYGHSLGSMNAQSAISDVDEKYAHRIKEVYLYNGPNIYKTLSDKQRENIKNLNHKIFNYVDTNDFIGLGYDNYQAVGKVYKIQTESKGLLGFVDQHNWGGYRYDADGNLIHKNGELVSPETRIRRVDFNDDGQIDFTLGSIDERSKNLLTNEKSIITNSTKIIINVSLLDTLSMNLSQRIQEDVSEMLKITQLCIEKNQKISKGFGLRKQKVSETIKEVLKNSGFLSLIHDLNNSVGDMMQQKSLLEQGREYCELKNPFSNNQIPMVHGNELNRIFYNTQLANLRHVCESLVTQVIKEKTHTIFSLFTGEQTLLGSWQMIESATKHLLDKSDELFEGQGLRLGKKDGISDSLTIVLDIILKNTTELLYSLQNTVELIQGIATHFEQADQWLGTQLQNGQFIGEVPAPIVPSAYTAYLEKDGILDDVKDVLQAFDRQVEEKCSTYSRKVSQVYQDTLGQFEKGLERWHSLALDLEPVISQIEENYSHSVWIKEKTIIEKQVGDRFVTETTDQTRYWGQFQRLYPRQIVDAIDQLKRKIVSKTDGIQQALWQCDRIKGQIHHLEPILKPIVEEGVYQAFDLDEIVHGQKTVLQFARRLSQEIGYVAQVIVGEGMASKSIEVLQHKLSDTQRLMSYYAQFVGDCFGDNEYNIPSVTASFSKKFSLNKPVPY